MVGVSVNGDYGVPTELRNVGTRMKGAAKDMWDFPLAIVKVLGTSSDLLD